MAKAIADSKGASDLDAGCNIYNTSRNLSIGVFAAKGIAKGASNGVRKVKNKVNASFKSGHHNTNKKPMIFRDSVDATIGKNPAKGVPYKDGQGVAGSKQGEKPKGVGQG